MGLLKTLPPEHDWIRLDPNYLTDTVITPPTVTDRVSTNYFQPLFVLNDVLAHYDGRRKKCQGRESFSLKDSHYLRSVKGL